MNGRAWVFLGAVAILCVIMGRDAQRPLDAGALRRRAESAIRVGDAIGASRDFERALRIAPDDAQALGGLARALEVRGDTTAAIELQRRATLLAHREGWPLASRATALRNLGFALYRHRELGPAIAALTAIDSLGAGTLETDLVLGAARILNGEAGRLVAALPRLRERYGAIEPVWKLGLAARVASTSGNIPPRRALEMFIGVRAVPADFGALVQALGTASAPDPVSQALLARARTDADPSPEAGRLWAALHAGPLAGLAALGAADLAIAAGRPEEALARLDVPVGDLQTPRETIEYTRARALLALGRTTGAGQALDRALDANPLSGRSEALRKEIAGS